MAGYSEQQKALQTVRTLYGRSGFTEDHEHYRRVGCSVANRKFAAIGDTWQEVIAGLQAKVKQWTL